MTRAEALKRHGELARELSELHRELAEVLGAEKTAKVQSFMAAPGGTDRQRDQASTANALGSTKEVFKLRGEIDALVEERDHIRLLLAYGADT